MLNNIDHLNAWLNKVESLPLLPVEKIRKELPDLEATLKELEGKIPDADYQVARTRIENLKYHVSWLNPWNQQEALSNVMNYIGGIFFRIFH